MDITPPQISRSGRLLKKSTKMKEMEEFDIDELESQGRAVKRNSSSDELDDRRQLSPMKASKSGLNISPHIKKSPQMANIKAEMRKLYLQHNLSPGSKDSDSETETSESLSPSTSSDESERVKELQKQKVFALPQKKFKQSLPLTLPHQSQGLSSDEDEARDARLIIAESPRSGAKGKKKPMSMPRMPVAPKGKAKKIVKKAPVEKDQQGKQQKTFSAYFLWCKENRKHVVASLGTSEMININKKLGELWKSLPEKEKLSWRHRAKKMSLKSANGMIPTGSIIGSAAKAQQSRTKSPVESIVDALPLGAAAIDSAAHLRLIGDSMETIGKRIVEHKGQLAFSGIFSVLMDTLLCHMIATMNVTRLTPELENIPEEIITKNLDSIAYFVPGL